MTRTAAIRCVICECTPPSDTKPIRWAVPPLCLSVLIKSCRASCDANVSVAIALSILTKSIGTTRPAPMFVCPTSELPICPSGKPASRPWVSNCACGPCITRSKLGVFARKGALPFWTSDSPQPSRIHKTTGFGADIDHSHRILTLI